MGKEVVFVLVPGSFATPVFYDKVTPLLKARGYTWVEAPLLSANDGSRQPPATMEEDAAHIRTVITSVLNSGKDVVVAMHSYGGIPGTEAVKGLASTTTTDSQESGHVIGLVYITSFLAPIGESIRDIMQAYMPPEMHAAPLDIYLPMDPAMAPFVFNDLMEREGGAEEVQRYAGLMTNHSSVSYSGKATYEAWRDVPNVTYILATADNVVPPDVQHQMVDRVVAESKGKLRKVEMDGAGHAVNVTRPEIVVEELLRATKTEGSR